MDNLNQNMPTDDVRTNGRFTLLRADQLPEIDDIPWLIDDILPREGLACLFGQSGVGKSFLSLDIAAALGIGKQWFTRELYPSTVHYISLEGEKGIRRRTKAWEQVNKMPFPSLVSFIFDHFSLLKNDEIESLAELINRDSSMDDKPLIVIDTLNRATAGADENSSSDMGKILAGVSLLQSMTGGLILLIHHSGKDESRGMRGHSSLFAAMDTVIEVSKSGNRKWWKLAKSKDGRDGISYPFELETVILGMDKFGKEITSCAVIEAGDLIPPKSILPIGINQRTILAAFAEMQAENRIQIANTGLELPRGVAYDHAVDYLKYALVRVSDRHRKIRTKEAIESLVRQGYLNLDGDVLSLPLAE